MKKTFAIFGLMIVSLLLFTASTAQAQPAEVFVSSGAVLNFGLLSAPSDFDAIWTLNENNGELAKTGGNSMDFIGTDHNRGSFVITGEPASAINYSLAVTTNFSNPGLSLAVTPSGGVLLLGLGGEAELLVGGVLTMHTSVSNGPQGGAVITLTVNYE